MARQKGPIYFTGEYNGMIGYQIDEVFYFRMKPESVAQSEATKKAADDFGAASSCGKLIRQALGQAMDLEQEHDLTNRLNKIMAKILRKDTAHKTGSKVVLPQYLSMLKEFSFNKVTKVDNVLRGIQAVIEQQDHISISIPAIAKIKRARNTTHIEIKAIAITADFAKDTFKQTSSEAVIINARQSFEALELTLPRPGSDTTMIILQVRALQIVGGDKSVMEDKNYEAADIIAVLPPMPVVQVKPNHKPKLKKIPVPETIKHYFGSVSFPQRE